ncbi:hypothetical protein V8G54_020267 [Vigna mungo]|uniref:Uncharacterized protein n=1 Tax=Vigna mungo TaxID=3915 RepID=A0AAQ3NDC6_VIGMU
MLWNSSPNLSQVEWWCSTRVKFWTLLMINPISPINYINNISLFLLFSGSHPQRGTHFQPPISIPKVTSQRLKLKISNTLVCVRKSNLGGAGQSSPNSRSRKHWSKRLHATF